jgi:hypothetical protein
MGRGNRAAWVDFGPSGDWFSQDFIQAYLCDIYFLLRYGRPFTCVCRAAKLTEGEDGALAKLVPGVEGIQQKLGMAETKIDAVKQDTEALRKGQ